jgi:hydrogenase maturation protease
MQAHTKPPRVARGDESRRALSRGRRSECPRTLVIGLGNPLVSDDSVGLRVAAFLKDRLANRHDVDVTEDYWGGLRLMERMIGYQRAIVIDAMCTGAAPGTVHLATAREFATHRSASAHDVDLPTALAFGRAAGAALPRDENVTLVGIEAADLIRFGEQCTPEVTGAIPLAIAEVVRLLDPMQGEQSR